MAIAEYLDKTYPETPQVIPHNTLALQTAFADGFLANFRAIFDIITLLTTSKLNPRSEEYYRRTREKWFGKKMEEMAPKGEAAIAQWSRFKDGVGKVDAWYAKNGGKGPFLLGEAPSWGDIVVASFLVFLRIVWGEDSPEWKDVSSWHNGRWAGIVEALKKYETVV